MAKCSNPRSLNWISLGPGEKTTILSTTLRGLDTLSRFLPFLIVETNLFARQITSEKGSTLKGKNVFPSKGSTLKGKNLLRREQILSFSSRPPFQKRIKQFGRVVSLEIVSISLKTIKHELFL